MAFSPSHHSRRMRSEMSSESALSVTCRLPHRACRVGSAHSFLLIGWITVSLTVVPSSWLMQTAVIESTFYYSGIHVPHSSDHYVVCTVQLVNRIAMCLTMRMAWRDTGFQQ
jgi:hypothetical protein